MNDDNKNENKNNKNNEEITDGVVIVPAAATETKASGDDSATNTASDGSATNTTSDGSATNTTGGASEANTAGSEPESEKNWRDHLTSREHWMRFVYMALFAIISGLACYVIAAVVILQFLWMALTGKLNNNLLKLGNSLTLYIQQALSFLTYNTEQKPFPFSDWPQSKVKDD